MRIQGLRLIPFMNVSRWKEVLLREVEAALRTFREETTKHEVAGFRNWASGFRVQSSEFRLQFRVKG